MALRTLRIQGDPILTKKCKKVDKLSDRDLTLIDDMLETMYEAEGVGLAAPQVGILKNIVVIDIGEGPMVLVNPEITEEEGSQRGSEGCLSVPGKAAIVSRPLKVKGHAFDADMKEYEFEGEGLLARAICHELDHLKGRMYTEIAESAVMSVEELERMLEEQEEKAGETKTQAD